MVISKGHCLPVLLLATIVLRADAAAQPAPRPAPDAKPGRVSDALVEAMRPLPEHARPLYALGDVNEDGDVDGRDRVLIHALARTAPAEWPAVPDASCGAAADLDLDGKVDAADTALADEWLGEGRIVTPALYHQPALSCRYERLIAASLTEAAPGEDLPVWILAPGYVGDDVEIRVEAGAATRRPGTEPRTILLAVAKESRDDTLVLRLSFRGGPSYLLNLPLVVAP